MFYALDSLLNFFAPTVQPVQKKVFPKHYYHPLYGLPSKVDTPSIPLNFTYFRVPPRHLFLLNGDLERHFACKEEYKEAWCKRKLNSWYDTDVHPTQISSYRNPVIIEKRMNYLTGKKVSSRDKRYKPDTFYATAKSMSYGKCDTTK